ncbi:MAG: monovalent cation/H(+) antiporter subunit G [Hyphomonadaceae bacterium]|nr:monovalent cation/H(+) antiporter subunit G [Hyphomonadaceae bacterium]
METLAAAIEFVRLGVSALLIAAGAALMLMGVIGRLRFPDLFTRLHAANVSDAHGAAVFVLGLAVAAPNAALFFRLLMLALLIGALAPALLHLIAGAAHSGGLAPLAGRYVAPRPGVRVEGGQ